MKRLPRVSINVRDAHAHFERGDVKLLCNGWKNVHISRKLLRPDVSFFQNFLDSFVFPSPSPMFIQNVELEDEEANADLLPSSTCIEPCNKIEAIDNLMDKSSAIEDEVHDLKQKVVEVSGALGQVMKCLSDATNQLKMFQEQQRILISEVGEQVKMLKAQPSPQSAVDELKKCKDEVENRSNVAASSADCQQSSTESISPPSSSAKAEVKASKKEDPEDDEWHILEEEDEGFVVVR